MIIHLHFIEYTFLKHIFILQELKDISEKKGKRKKGGGHMDEDDTEASSGVRKRLKGKNGRKGK